MAQESELQVLRDELQRLQNQTRRSRRWVVVGFGILLLAICISMLYAFVQQVEATRFREEANRQRMLAEEAKIQADKNAEEALRQQALAADAMRAAQLQLEECAKSKRK